MCEYVVLCCVRCRREKQEQMLKQVNESTLNRLTAGQNGSAQEQAAKGRLISQVRVLKPYSIIYLIMFQMSDGSLLTLTHALRAVVKDRRHANAIAKGQ
jgi:hypothetical protein